MSFQRSATAIATLVSLGLLSGVASAQDHSSMPGMGAPRMEMPGTHSSGWQIHSHTVLSLVADSQEGPRGDNKTFIEGMTMLMASRRLSDQTDLSLEAMFSPDAFMGKSGYPLLLQTGETADGVTHLVDRQHPHDLVMGLTATVTRRLTDGSSVFAKVGYPGEFAFGPTAFMHRASGETFPTAPISHHWLDSGHITMGVATAGWRKGPVTVELSQFTGREPDEKRFNLDPVHLDSTAMRLSWQVTPDLKAQASWARQVSPETLEPDVNLIKSSLSLENSRDLGDWGALNTTLAYGRKRTEHGTEKASDAWLFENTWVINPKWSGLLRYERAYNNELAPGAWWVGKTELGAVRTFAVNDMTSVSVGVVRQLNTLPDALKPSYGANPDGTVAFMTLRLHAMKM